MSLNKFRVIEEKRRFEEGERQEQALKLAPLQKELSANLQRAAKMTRAFWSQDLRHLATLINAGSFEPDHGITFPSTTEKQGGDRGRAEFEEFVHVTLQKSGLILSGAGEQRLTLYTVAQAMSQNAALANPETWRTAFDRLYQLGCFDEAKGEIGYDESQRVPDPVAPVVVPEPTMADLESIPTHTLEGAAKAREIVSKAVFGDEARSVFQEFVAHVSKTFGHDLTPDEQFEIVSWFQKNNKSFLDRRAYDQAKVNLIRRNILPESLLTADEKLQMAIESSDTQSWEGRSRLKQGLLASRNRI
jgi:hypothetical protein